MKKTWIAVCLSALCLAILSGWTVWAQVSKSPAAGSPQLQRELDIMKGVIRTTLTYALNETRGEETTSGRGPRILGEYFDHLDIGAYYLQGQGAVFTIQADNLLGRFGSGPGNLEALLEYEDAVNEREMELQELLEQQKQEAEEEAAVEEEDPPSRSTPPPVREKEQSRRAAQMERAKKQAATLQERLRQQKEQLEKRRSDFQSSIARIKEQLIDALAGHGDSMSRVQANEYINIIITPDERIMLQPVIMSVPRSAVVDFKAGRLTRDAFRAKVLDYTN